MFTRTCRARLHAATAASDASGSPAYSGECHVPASSERQLAPRQRVGAPLAIGRAIERVVVQQECDAVGRQLDVELRHAVAVRVAEAKRGQRVLGRELAGAAMRAELRIGPGRQGRTWPSAQARAGRGVEREHARGIGGDAERRSDRRRRAVRQPRDDRAAAMAEWTSARRRASRPFRPVPTASRRARRTASRCSGRTPTVTARPLRERRARRARLRRHGRARSGRRRSPCRRRNSSPASR